jgi:hypothetical protein
VSPRQSEQPGSLSERGGCIRRRVDEDVPMIKRDDEREMRRSKQAIAENIAGHVTDADDGQR